MTLLCHILQPLYVRMYMYAVESHEIRTPPYTGQLTEVLLHRTAYCGPSGVLIIEVSLYRTVYCGPNNFFVFFGILFYVGPL